jgi:hypothetical protein
MLGLALDRIAEAQAAAGRLAHASRRAERTHLRAADVHERAAELYESLGKAAEAARERAQASRDRTGAESNDAGALSDRPWRRRAPEHRLAIASRQTVAVSRVIPRRPLWTSTNCAGSAPLTTAPWGEVAAEAPA